MAIFKRGGVYWYEFEFKGDRVRESAHTGNKETARQIAAAHRTRLAKGQVGIIERAAAPTLKDFAPRFEDAIVTLCADKPATVKFYREKLTRLLEDSELPVLRLDAIDESVIDSYKQRRTRQASRHGKPLAPASVNRELATLRRLLRLAQEWKEIDRVPRIRLLRGEHHREFVLSRQQEPIYLGALPETLRKLATFLLDTGLRVGEALSLEWSNVHLKPAEGAKLGYLRVTARNSKNSKSRNVPLTSRAAEILKGLGPGKSGLVFHDDEGNGLYQTWLNQQHSAVRTLLKLPMEFVPHSLRHTYGTRLGEGGADAFTIMRLMGHSSVTISQRYVHPSPESMEKAVQAMEAGNVGNAAKVPTISTTVKSGKMKKPK